MKGITAPPNNNHITDVGKGGGRSEATTNQDLSS